MFDEMTIKNAPKFALFLEYEFPNFLKLFFSVYPFHYILLFFTWCLNERQFWFWIFLLYHFIKQKPLVSEECGDDDTFCIQFASIHETTSQAESNSRERELPKKPWELIHDWDVWAEIPSIFRLSFFSQSCLQKSARNAYLFGLCCFWNSGRGHMYKVC